MQRLEVSFVVRPIYGSLGAKGFAVSLVIGGWQSGVFQCCRFVIVTCIVLVMGEIVCVEMSGQTAFG
jgi:hypothetical protein